MTAIWRCSKLNNPTYKAGSAGNKLKPIASPIRPLCSKRSAAVGGTGRNSQNSHEESIENNADAYCTRVVGTGFNRGVLAQVRCQPAGALGDGEQRQAHARTAAQPSLVPGRAVQFP